MLHVCNLLMHSINQPLSHAKVDERVSWWSGGQTCYQVQFSIVVKLVVQTLLSLCSLQRFNTDLAVNVTYSYNSKQLDSAQYFLDSMTNWMSCDCQTTVNYRLAVGKRHRCYNQREL